MPPKKKVKKAVKDDAEPREDEKVVENLESPQITPVVEVALPTPTADVPPKPNKASRLSVDAISSSPIVDLAATYWATPHDVSVCFFHLYERAHILTLLFRVRIRLNLTKILLITCIPSPSLPSTYRNSPCWSLAAIWRIICGLFFTSPPPLRTLHCLTSIPY